LIKNGQLTDGRDKLSEEIRFSKSHPNPYFYYFRGVYIYYIYLNEKLRSKEDKAMLEEMKDSLEEALKYEKLFPEAHFYLGMYYYELCDYKNAIAEFTLSIEEAGKKWKEDKKTSEKWISAAENFKKLSAFGSIKKEDIMPPFPDIDNKGKKLPEGNKINLPVPEGLN
jgi:tetratricopeptide (TPR) repeat protein